MKITFPALVAFGALAAIALTLRVPRNSDEYDIAAFGRLPTLVNGRVKPLDSVARTTLLVLQGRQRVTTAEGGTLSPDEWLLDVLFRPERANAYPGFEIVHPEVLTLFDLAPGQGAGGKRFALAQLAKGLAELDRQAKLADDTESGIRTSFQRAVIQLRDNIVVYQRLGQSLAPAGADDYFEQVAELQRGTAPAQTKTELARTFSAMDSLGYLRPIPPEQDVGNMAGWKSIGASLAEGLATGHFNRTSLALTELGRAWRERRPDDFNRVVHACRAQLEAGQPAQLRRTDLEVRFNSAQPFYTSAVLYVAAFLLGMISWLRWPEAAGRAAFRLMAIAFSVTTLGIAARMWLEARPPVTNLYSSALFVGWGAVGLCLVLERFHRNGVGTVAGGLIGFATLLIAHHLSLGGDTLEMMRAVLDSNFWLATHVVTIAVGYSATFLAGFLGIIYVLRGVLTRSLDDATAASLGRMIYGVVCFATLFSFVGTILGGIWADQSWGRFWGWDPKENGALIIVIWNSVLLHVRWGGMVKTRGLACLAVFGNIVTAWSWFGVNMLGVGLHSYGFMDSAVWWLVAFAALQAGIILVGAVPPARWRSVAAAHR
jgi:ABC-type transport system involved in cytochrome c biogenesis permease subunit